MEKEKIEKLIRDLMADYGEPRADFRRKLEKMIAEILRG